MSSIAVAARRVIVLLAIGAAAATLMAWWRGAPRHDAPASPPQWPPFDPVVSPARSAPATLPWRPAESDGSPAPDGFPVKVKVTSGIYHQPGGRFYDRTRPDRWYATAEAAEADGYRRSKT